MKGEDLTTKDYTGVCVSVCVCVCVRERERREREREERERERERESNVVYLLVELCFIFIHRF